MDFEHIEHKTWLQTLQDTLKKLKIMDQMKSLNMDLNTKHDSKHHKTL